MCVVHLNEHEVKKKVLGSPNTQVDKCPINAFSTVVFNPNKQKYFLILSVFLIKTSMFEKTRKKPSSEIR